MAETPGSGVEIASRFEIAQSWWVASELVRRSPHLFVHEWHPGGGGYDCLGLFDDRGPRDGAVLDLNRAGRLRVLKPVQEAVATWEGLHGAENPYAVVKRMEQAARPVPVKRPHTTPRSLTYSVIAQILASLLNDRHTWDARSLNHDTSGDWDEDAERHAWASAFPTALALTRPGSMPELGWHGEPWSHFWALTKNGEPVSLLDVDGGMHRQDGESVDLMKIYRSNCRSVTSTVAQASPTSCRDARDGAARLQNP